jgi:hypothetical protein
MKRPARVIAHDKVRVHPATGLQIPLEGAIDRCARRATLLIKDLPGKPVDLLEMELVQDSPQLQPQ